ncbi:MAG: hypothetical protein NE330_04745 [Lentisphaeraceae bacterium]|nr:hypothetical protein [Lentisphaeraceae bacterium]
MLSKTSAVLITFFLFSLNSQALLWESVKKIEKKFGKAISVEEGEKIDRTKYAVKKYQFKDGKNQIFAYANKKDNVVRLTIVTPDMTKYMSDKEMFKYLKMVEKGKWSRTDTDFISSSKKWQCVYSFGYMVIVKYIPN